VSARDRAAGVTSVANLSLVRALPPDARWEPMRETNGIPDGKISWSHGLLIDDPSKPAGESSPLMGPPGGRHRARGG
jgi:hypothetical protein